MPSSGRIAVRSMDIPDRFAFRLLTMPNPRHPAGAFIGDRVAINHNLHLIHVLTGALEFRLGDGRRAVGTPRSVVSIPPFQTYTCHRKTDDAIEMINIHFHLHWDDDWSRKGALVFPLSFEPENLPRCHRTLRSCLNVWTDGNGTIANRWRCALRLHQLIAGYGSRFAFVIPPRPADQVMQEVRLEIEQAATRGDFQAANFASRASLSIPQFNRRFRQAHGLSPKSYWQHCRLRLARELLKEQGRSVKEVAEALDFSNPYYFSRWFRQLQGVPPSEFREHCDQSMI